MQLFSIEFPFLHLHAILKKLNEFHFSTLPVLLGPVFHCFPSSPVRVGADSNEVKLILSAGRICHVELRFTVDECCFSGRFGKKFKRQSP